jgi:acylphosphatase
MTTLHLIIQGKVQGVFFRVSAKRIANQLGITGWVKNTPEKHVEIMASGTSELLQQFTDWCREGPSDARVDKVIMKELAGHHFDEFKILH